MQRDLSESVALVTGAAGGIGRAVAQRLARGGAHVVVSDVDEAGGAETVRLVEGAGGAARFVAADVSEPEACARLVEQTVEAYGRLDIACNNAGVGGAQAKTADYPVEEWDRVLRVTSRACSTGCARRFRRCSKRAAAPSSTLRPSWAAWAWRTHRVRGGQAWRRGAHADGRHRVRAKGVRVNAVGPGFIDTEMVSGVGEEARQMLVGRHPIGRFGTPEEVAALVAWLASREALVRDGAYVPVDGGYLAR